jgi:rod shape determining protein RodA
MLTTHNHKKLQWSRFHLDGPLLLCLIALSAIGLIVLYSAGNLSFGLVGKQAYHLGFAFLLMIAAAQVPPHVYQKWAPWIFTLGVALLVAVLVFGTVDKGAKRWLNLGFIRFQPSELLKIAMPLMLASYFDNKDLPPKAKISLIAVSLLALPTLLIAKQPDLGTGILIALSGSLVILLAGISWQFITSMLGLGLLSAPILWHHLHTYQKARILTFLNPERDPLGSGYHIIQSKIAIGSGGIWGKGWLHGTQSHLHFLPEHTTDFIFAVASEEFGLIGCLIILITFCLVLWRCIVISIQAQTTFSRLLSGGLAFTIAFCALINIGMVIGILPVVGVPLPLISYGGSSMVTTLLSFGMIMSTHTHRKLLSR